MRDQDEIAQLKHQYCYTMDVQDAEGFTELFTTDAVFDITDVLAGQGRDELAEFIEILRGWNTNTMAHMVTNPVLEITGDEAAGTWYYLVLIEYPDGRTEFGQGRYDETYRRVDGEWKIATIDATRRLTREI